MVFVLIKSTFRFYKRRTGIAVIDSFLFYFFVGRRHFNGTYRQDVLPENANRSFKKRTVGTSSRLKTNREWTRIDAIKNVCERPTLGRGAACCNPIELPTDPAAAGRLPSRSFTSFKFASIRVHSRLIICRELVPTGRFPQ